MSVEVSVVVPTCRRDDLLARCLDALLAQDLPPHAYEVIVVDDAPCCATEMLVATRALASRACGPVLRYIAHRCAHGPAAARNAGWRAARGALIAFTDDDCIPAPGWLAAGVRALADGAVGATGRIEVPLPPAPTDYERDAAALAASTFVTANCFYRRDALATVGGFDARFTAPWREDSDLLFTFLERGARLVDAPDAVVTHPVRPARWGVSVCQQRKSMFNALLYKKHPALYRRRVQAAPPWRYYGIVAALLAGASALVGGRRRAALAAGALWTAWTARFALQRVRHTSRRPRHLLEMAVTSAAIPPLAVYWRLRGAIAFRVWFL